MTNQQGAPEALANFDAAVAAVLQCVSTAPCNSHEICTWFAANIRERLAALVEAQQPAPSAAAAEHYDEVRATLTGLHALCENISAMERRVGPLGSHARGYTHKITAALRHLEALVSPTPQADSAPADPDGEAFRTAARLGLTLRFYGGCAQSSMPGTPSAYEVVAGQDRATAMREAVERAAAVVARGGEPQRLDSLAPQADSQPAPDEIVSVAREQGLPETEIEGVFRVNADDLCRVVAADRAARAPADSVTAPAGGEVAGPSDYMLGPWFAAQHSGYSTQYWTIKRRNPAWLGGTETGMNGNCNPRRFKTEAAAQKAADELNAAAPTTPAQAADSVEDAARLWDEFIEAWRNELGVDKIVNIMGGADKLKAVFLDAARKQGGA